MIAQLIFWPAALVAMASTLCVLFSKKPVYAVLYLVLSIISTAFMIYSLGAAPLAIFEVIVYAGAIVVFFLFVVMMLNLGTGENKPDLRPLWGKELIYPGVLAGILMIGIFAAVVTSPGTGEDVGPLTLEVLGRTLFSDDFLGVKLASLILLIATVGGMHLGSAASPESQTNSQSGGDAK
jgi:NADH-quinone oxidoreductase subunit J